jgi:hypothetical protein
MRIRMVLGKPWRLARECRRRIGEKGHDVGMATAEYAVGIVAACSFAGLLLAILKSPEVRTILLGMIKKALSAV